MTNLDQLAESTLMEALKVAGKDHKEGFNFTLRPNRDPNKWEISVPILNQLHDVEQAANQIAAQITTIWAAIIENQNAREKVMREIAEQYPNGYPDQLPSDWIFDDCKEDQGLKAAKRIKRHHALTNLEESLLPD